MNKRQWLRGGQAVFLAGLISAAIMFFIHTHAARELRHINVEQLSLYLRSFGAFSFLLGMAAVYVQTMLPVVPFVLVAGANVLVFGLYWGFVINYVMAVLGSYTAFLFARYLGHERVEKSIYRHAAAASFHKRMEERGFFYVLLGRLIPVIPSVAVSLGAGVTKVKAREFVLATLLGKLPMVALESFIGHDLLHFHQYKGRLLVLCTVFILLLIAGTFFKNKLTGKTVE